MTKLRSLLPAIGARAEALLIAGTQKTHLKDLAARFALSVYRLRKDLNAFLRGRLEQVTARTRHPDAQDMLRKGFFKWCDSQYAQHNNQCPTGRAAQEYLRTMHLEVKMPTVYWYLKLWRQERQRHNQVVPGRNYERSINFETGAEKRHLGSLEKWHARRNERPAKR